MCTSSSKLAEWMQTAKWADYCVNAVKNEEKSEGSLHCCPDQAWIDMEEGTSTPQ